MTNVDEAVSLEEQQYAENTMQLLFGDSEDTALNGNFELLLLAASISSSAKESLSVQVSESSSRSDNDGGQDSSMLSNYLGPGTPLFENQNVAFTEAHALHEQVQVSESSSRSDNDGGQDSSMLSNYLGPGTPLFENQNVAFTEAHALHEQVVGEENDAGLDTSAQDNLECEKITFCEVKRRAWKQSFKKTLNKANRHAGKAYEGTTTKTPDGRKQTIVKKISAGKMCNFQKHPQIMKCSEFNDLYITQFHADHRQNHPTKEAQQIFVKSSIHITKSERGQERAYYLRHPQTNKTLRICKDLFSSCVGVPVRTVRRWTLTNEKPSVQVPQQAVSRKKPDKEGLDSFFEKLPRMESHYARAAHEGNTYICNSEDLNDNGVNGYITLDAWIDTKYQLHKVYLKFCQENGFTPFGRTAFTEEMDRKKVKLWRPKKDLCNTCEKHKSRVQAAKTQGKELPIEEDKLFEEHLERKSAARENLKRLLSEAKTDERQGKLIVVQVDLEACMTLPKHNANILYYRTRLANHNYTAKNLVDGSVDCFFWSETDGGLTASVFASILQEYLNNAQNRNFVLSNMLLEWAVLNKIEIQHYYLEPGHTQMSVDSAHSMIERRLRRQHSLFVPRDLVKGIVLAKKNPNDAFVVHRLKYCFFKDFTKLKHFTTIRPSDGVVTDIRALRYAPNGQVLYKKTLNEEWKELRRKRKAFTINDQQLGNLYQDRIPIKRAKYNHLQDIKKVIMPQRFWRFYANLPHD
ncbi:uncharacterized protein LOC135937712 isoform X2 [Cloeon dipterum]|uniref:uncharacterized protein LOC135937712 isoform X2 n=1 Tax=Cloeon dipterum TaxID=197152 RepID=UPI00321FAAFE